MKKILSLYYLFFTTWIICSACSNGGRDGGAEKKVVDGRYDTLPAPYATKPVKNFSKVIGWPQGKTPVAPAGFTVTKFADGLDNPRWIYVAANGDVFVAESNTVLKGLKKIGAKISRKIKTQNYGN